MYMKRFFKKVLVHMILEAKNPVICPFQTGDPGKLVVFLEGPRVRE